MAREFLTANAFIIDDDDVLRRISFGIRRLPVIAAPIDENDASVMREYHIKTAALQAEAIEVLLRY